MKAKRLRLLVFLMTLLLTLSILMSGVYAQEEDITIELEDGSTVTEMQDEAISAQASQPVNVTDKTTSTLAIGKSLQLSATNSTGSTLYWHTFRPCANWITPSGLYLAKHRVYDLAYAENAEQQFDSKTVHVTGSKVPYFNSESDDVLTVGETYKNPAIGNGTLNYSSYNPSIASVDSNGKVTALAEGMTRIFVKDAEGNEANYCVFVKKSSSVFTMFSTSSIVMSNGTLTAVQLVTAPTQYGANTTLSCTSSNSDVAAVYTHSTSSGFVGEYTEILIRAKKAGTTTISCKNADGKTYKCNVTVVASPSTLTLNKTSMTLEKGKSAALSATNTKAPIKCFMSSDDTIAQVDDNGKVYGIKPGTATITAYLDNGKTATCKVTVKYAAATSVTLSKTTLSLDQGANSTLTATVSPATADPSVTWKSSDSSVAKVSAGKVTAVKVGTATITATSADGKASVTCKVTVKSTSSSPSSTSTSTKAVYRLYSPITGEHLYTTDKNEYETLWKSYGWGKEGIAWYAPSSGTAVYRLYQPSLQNHLYTTDKNEVNTLCSKYGWKKDNGGNPVYYSGGSIPIYRVYNAGLNGMHHLTTEVNEYNTLPKYGWQQEGSKLSAAKLGSPLKTTNYYNKK